MSRAARPHPTTGQAFVSPVPPGTGWPDDPAAPDTPVAHDATDVIALASTSDDTRVLDARSTVCRACPRLVSWREEVATTGMRASLADQPYWGRPGPGFGDPHPHTLVVGLAPAAQGCNRTGRVFTGDRSGDWLFAGLYRAGYASQPTSEHAGDGLSLTGLRIVAAVRCAPPANKPTTAEIATCAPWLHRELTLAEPTLRSILALGGIGWRAVLTTARQLGWEVARPAPRFGHGARTTLIASGHPIVLLGSYHVSQQNTFTGKLTETMFDQVLAHL